MKKITLLCFLLPLLLSSCSGLSLQAASNDGSDACIRPMSKIAYPIGTPTRSPDDAKKLDVEPLANWQLESTLPEFSEGINTLQLVANSNQIWVLDTDAANIFLYDSIKQTWKTYRTLDGYTGVPETLFATTDGHVWGIDVNTPGFGIQHQLPLLSRYNADKDQFESIKDIDGILENVSTVSSPATVVEDQNGVLWFWGSVPADHLNGLYSFNPATQKAARNLYISQPDWFPAPNALFVDKNNNLWLGNFSKQNSQLFTYSPETQELEPYSAQPDFNHFGPIWSLFLDREGNIWYNNGQAWLDFSDKTNPVWHKLILPPEFLTDDGWFWLSDGINASHYGLELPSHIFQSSNGWYWFTTLHGTIRLDMRNEQWCLFTTGSSPVVEDDRGNLWITVFGKLYKYQLNK